MKEKYITYKTSDGRTFDVPESYSAVVEHDYPDATIEMRLGDRIFDVPVSSKEDVLKSYGNQISYSFEDKPESQTSSIMSESASAFEDTKEEPISFATTPAEKNKKPSFWERAAASAVRSQSEGFDSLKTQSDIYDDSKTEDRTGLFETIGKAGGAAGVTVGKQAVDLVNEGAKMGAKRPAYGNPLTNLAATIEAITGKSVLDDDNPLERASIKMGEVAEKLIEEADPTHGEKGFGELIGEGNIGMAAQKALASGIESLPIMLASASGPIGMTIYGASMSASNFADSTRENPEINDVKRGVYAVGTAATELLAEKIGGPLKKIFGFGGGEITEAAAKEVVEKARKEGAKLIKSRILKALKFAGKIGKEGLEEGGEEVVTSFGNDLLGEALDIIEGNKDYGIRAQWEKYKEQNPNATIEDFADAKGNEYFEAFLGGALSGAEISSVSTTVNEIATAKDRKQMNAARAKGSTLGLANMYDLDEAVKEQADATETVFTDESGEKLLSRDFIDNMSSEDAFNLSLEEDLSNKQKIALRQLANAKAMEEGLTTSLDNSLASTINAQKANIEKATENGKIVVGTVNGQPVYVKGAVVQNGSLTLPTGENGPVIIINAATGEQSSVNTNEIENFTSRDAAEYAGWVETMFTDKDQQDRQTARTTMSVGAKLKAVTPYAGKKMYVDFGNGLIEVGVQRVLPTGEVIIQGKKGDLGGQSIKTMGVGAFYDSIYRDENGNPIFTDGELEPVESQPTEAPAGTAEANDYRGQSVTILINGKPVEVEVTSQDNTSDRITYEYVDENGNARTGGSTISEFETAIQQASTNESPNPENDIESINEEPITLELMNWDELLQTNPEEFFKEVQMRFGNSAINFLKEEIEYTKREINSLKGQIGNTLHERAMTSLKIDELQSKINTLSSMVSRLEPAPQNEVESVPVAPETPVAEAPLEPAPEPVEETPIEAPVAETPVEPVEETPVEPEVAPETPVEETPVAPAEPVEETPIQPEPQATPVAPTPVDNPIEVAKKWEETLISLINRKGIAKEIKIDSARHIGRVIADLFATREEYEAYEAEAADLGEYLSYFDEGVNESFAVRNNQQNTGETPINSVPLENEPNGESNGEQETGEVGTGRHTNIGIQGTTVGEGQGENKGDKGEKGSKSQGTNNKGTKEVEDKYPARKGNATPDLLVKTFGLESVNLPKSKNGQKALNSIYDFLMEMSKMLGISPTSIGQGGWLELRDLRGNAGRSAAHSIRDIFGDIIEVYIELKSSRLSSIAHEWFHSLDRALSYFNTGRIHAAATESLPQTFDGRPEVLAAMDDIIRAIEDSGHPKRIQSIGWPRKHKTYLLRLMEMAARAFEQYIEDKFAAAGIIIENYEVNKDNLQQPTAEEMAVIAPAFDKLFEVLQEKEGKTPGTSVLFQIGEMVDKNTEASQLATENIINVLRDSKIEVVKLTDENVEQMIPLSKVDGTIYGWTDGKKIYLTEAGINPNTPIHEYTHLWAKAMMQNNPKGWQSVKDLLRGTAIWDEVMNDTNYSNIHNDEDAVASEALSRISGRDGAAKMEQMAQQMIDEAKGTARKLEARGLIQRMKDALNEFWSWVGTNLFKIEKFDSVEQVTDRVLWDLMNATDLGELSEGQVETQIVTDPKVISELEASPKRTGYRNVVMNEDGTFSSPMAYWLQSPKGGAKTRVETAKFELGKWEEAEENTDLVDERGHITLVKPNKGTIDVAYDPYIHNRLDPVNLQFKDAWKRNDLVYVETEVPETDLESGYHADKALLSVGVHSWSNGDVMLSKYDKPVRIVPWEEVADAWVARLNGEGVHFDVVPPALLPLLVERGVEILPPHKGMGKDCFDAYAEWKKENPQSDSRDLTSSQSPKVELNQTAERAQTKDAAKIRKSVESLRELSRVSKKIKESRPEVLVDVLAEALNIDPSQRRNKSKRNKYTLPNGETLSVRASDHNTDSNTYIEFNFNQNYNLAITFKSKHSKKTFKANENVRLDEYVYFVEDIKQYDGSVLSEVAASLADFLESGIYEDTTGLVTINTSPEGVAPRTKENYSEIKRRKSYAQNAAVDNLVGEARLRAIEHAVNAEASNLGVKVTYKTREQMPKGHHNEKGYYNPNTGEIVVCTENASSIADAIQTILHEAVAHKGLRELMGDRFNEFINRVYESLDAETKAKVDARAAAEYGGDTAVAMEEYMATLAESTDFNNDTLWDKIKSIFEDIINAILGRNDIKIGDNELRYILRASYNNMVNPRGMETVRGWAQDQMMREDYGVNKATQDIIYRTGIDPTEAASQTAKEVYDNVVHDNWQEFQRQFQDAMQPVRIAIDAIQQETGNIPIEDYENYILIQNQASSRSRVEIDEFHRKYYSPIIEQVNAIIDKIMTARGYKINDKKRRAEVYAEIKQYLIAKHGLERNAYYQSTKTKMVDGEEVPDMRDYSGLTTLFGMSPTDFEAAEEAAQEFVDKFEAEVGDATDALWKKINTATSKTLRHSYESGIISRQQYDDISGMFDFYIPLRGFDETTAEDVYSYARFEGNRFSAAVQTAKGRTSLANDPIAYIMNMAESEIAQGNKNRAKQALYHFILNRPVTDADGNQTQNSLMQVENVWYIKSVDGFGREVYTIAHPDHAAGETMQEFEAKMKALAETGEAVKSKKGKVDVGMRFQKPTHANEHYIYLKVNGVEKAIYVNGDPKAAQAVNGTFAEPLGEGAQKVRNVQRVLSQTFTNYSIEFTARNYMRDLIYSHINIGVRESDPAYRRRFRQNWRKNNLGTMLKLIKAYRAGELEGRQLTEVEAAFVEFMSNGGQTGYTLINSIEAHKRDLERAIENMQKGVVNGGVKDSTIFKFTLGNIELLNEASELVTRFAAFKTSRDMGRSVVKSISDAKEVTVNFNTRGAQDGKGWMGVAARYLGWSKFFFNASVQGVQNITAMAKANKLKFCGVVGGVAATGFMMPVLTAVIHGMLNGDDDDEKNPYWNIPEYERQNNICVVIGDGKYVKIPLPIGFREIYALGDMVAAMSFDKKFKRDATQIGTDMANKIASIVLPINPLESTANGLSLWHTGLYTLLPSSLQFLVQNATNIDWKGAPLQKEYTYNQHDPQWMKAFESNPDWMVGLSKWCNEHIGTGDMKGMDWSPEKLDNTLSNLFGGIYSLVKKTGKSFSMIWNEENRNLSNIPLAGVILGSGADNDDRYITDVYYQEKRYYDDRLSFVKTRAEKFGYDLDDVFNKEKGKQHPKMHEIYDNKEYEFMKAWYLGHEGNPRGESKQAKAGLNKLHNEIKKLEKKIAQKENPSPGQTEKLSRLQQEFEDYRREVVDELLKIE